MKIPEKNVDIDFISQGSRLTLKDTDFPAESKSDFRFYGKILSAILSVFGRTYRLNALENGRNKSWIVNRNSFEAWVNSNTATIKLEKKGLSVNQEISAFKNHYQSLKSEITKQATKKTIPTLTNTPGLSEKEKRIRHYVRHLTNWPGSFEKKYNQLVNFYRCDKSEVDSAVKIYNQTLHVELPEPTREERIIHHVRYLTISPGPLEKKYTMLVNIYGFDKSEVDSAVKIYNQTLHVEVPELTREERIKLLVVYFTNGPRPANQMAESLIGIYDQKEVEEAMKIYILRINN